MKTLQYFPSTHMYPTLGTCPTFSMFLSFGFLGLCLVRGHVSQSNKTATDESDFISRNCSMCKQRSRLNNFAHNWLWSAEWCPPNLPALIPGTCECYLVWGGESALQIWLSGESWDGWLAWILWAGPQFNHKCPYKREERDVATET